MPLLQLDDMMMHYMQYPAKGAADAETIVLIHGLGLDMTLWGKIIPLLTEHVRVVVYDLRGHGRSTGGEAAVMWETFITDLRSLFDALHIRKAHLVGHGFGGNVAAIFSEAHPDLVSRLVLISVPVNYPRFLIHKMINYRKRLADDGSLLGLAREMALTVTNSPMDSTDARTFIGAFSKTAYLIYFRILDLYLHGSRSTELIRIPCRTLLLAGENDPFYLRSVSLATQLIPDSSLLIVPNASNMPFIDSPETTAGWIIRFLQHEPVNGFTGMNAEIANEAQMAIRDFIEESEKKVSLMNLLKVDLLHSFRVVIDGQERLDGWNRRYAKNILVYLLFHQTATRETLCDALFPNLPKQNALRNLKVYLNYFKQMLFVPSAERSYLATDREHIVLHCTLKCDLIDLFQQLEEIQSEPDKSRKYELSLGLFDRLPDPLLPGLYDDWFLNVRSRLETQLAELALWMAETGNEFNNGYRSAHFRQLARRFFADEEEGQA